MNLLFMVYFRLNSLQNKQVHQNEGEPLSQPTTTYDNVIFRPNAINQVKKAWKEGNLQICAFSRSKHQPNKMRIFSANKFVGNL